MADYDIRFKIFKYLFYLCDPSVFEQADYVLVESTYGDRIHESFPETKQKLADAINETLRGKTSRSSSRGEVKEDQVTVTAEPNSNSVIVRGPAKEVPAVVKMIQELDKGGTSSTMQVRIYPLENQPVRTIR